MDYSSKIAAVVKNYENNSTLTINKDNYFFIKTSFEYKFDSKILEIFLRELESEVIYVFELGNKTVVCAMFYPNKEYGLLSNRSYHSVISKISSKTAIQLGVEIECSIIEFDSEISCLTYLVYLSNISIYNKLQESSNITEEDCHLLTNSELIERFGEKKWNKIPDIEKFGTIYKFKEQNRVSKLCGRIDYSDSDKYRNFLFKKQ